MAALTRPSEATYVINEEVTVRTSDREEHTFCGVMFPVKCKDTLPIDHIIIKSISVRGRLGPLTVWVSKDPAAVDAEGEKSEDRGTRSAASAWCGDDDDDDDGEEDGNNVMHGKKCRSMAMSLLKKNHIVAHSSQWTQIYSKYHRPSMSNLQELDFSSNPIIIKPNQVRGIYVHSRLPGDEGIVYDNHYGHMHSADTPSDNFVTLPRALAHVSNEPFGAVPIWGWGDSWRCDRKFVGSVNYGVVYKLWHPRENERYGRHFRAVARTLFLCQRRWESGISMLPDECLFYILNMMRWDWADDDIEEMKASEDTRRAAERDRVEREERNKCVTRASDSKRSSIDSDVMEEDSDNNNDAHVDSDEDSNGDEDDLQELMSSAELYTEQSNKIEQDDRYDRRHVAMLRHFARSHHNSYFLRGYMEVEDVMDDSDDNGNNNDDADYDSYDS
eukprot:CAMPEP_0172481088 /NCGR_PEP_ID=MMETSP1066-20121228/6669_1 /TAXON_ID=671091 /ORGANISM="Coscinodiscus wailesii, Strain CCMP2513" /LENGTH=443 /DNA_ID=CAMNT_0013243051 /DNA_START=143 /DNA_END=1474 /DNA_ORIENTATION=+